MVATPGPSDALGFGAKQWAAQLWPYRLAGAKGSRRRKWPRRVCGKRAPRPCAGLREAKGVGSSRYRLVAVRGLCSWACCERLTHDGLGWGSELGGRVGTGRSGQALFRNCGLVPDRRTAC